MGQLFLLVKYVIIRVLLNRDKEQCVKSSRGQVWGNLKHTGEKQLLTWTRVSLSVTSGLTQESCAPKNALDISFFHGQCVLNCPELMSIVHWCSVAMQMSCYVIQQQGELDWTPVWTIWTSPTHWHLPGAINSELISISNLTQHMYECSGGVFISL